MLIGALAAMPPFTTKGSPAPRCWGDGYACWCGTWERWKTSTIWSIPENFSGRLLEVPVGTGVLIMPVYKTLPNAEIICLDDFPGRAGRPFLIRRRPIRRQFGR